MILAVVLNLVASSLRRSHRRTQDLNTLKDACKSTCISQIGFFNLKNLIGHLFINEPEQKAGCMCFNNETPKSTNHWDKASQKFVRDTEHDGNLVAYYQRLKSKLGELILS